jgi:hypothetical protein
MFGNLGLHIIKYPTGRFGYVGSVPTALASIVPMTQAGALGSRAFKNEAGEWVEYQFPVFETELAAREFAASKGFKIKT